MQIAVVDIETTGRTPTEGTIVEIGIAMLDLRTHFISKLFDSVVRENKFLKVYEATSIAESWVFQNSDLKLDDVLEAPLWTQVRVKIQRILNHFPITAYNKDFDFGFLKSRGIKIPRELPCPMKVATPVLKLPPRYNFHDFKYPSVEESWNYFFPDKPYTESHRAYDDAVHEAEIVYQLYKIGAWKPIANTR